MPHMASAPAPDPRGRMPVSMDVHQMEEETPPGPQDSGDDAARKRDEVVKRMLNTPYRPHTADRKRKTRT